MGWTDWRKIADRQEWYGDELDWDAPACYELAIAGPRGGDLRPVYVGETSNERYRVVAYAIHGSHLAEIVNDHLRRGWTLWYRAQGLKSKAAAVAMQNRLLQRFDYDWNIQLNAKGKRWCDHLACLTRYSSRPLGAAVGRCRSLGRWKAA